MADKIYKFSHTTPILKSLHWLKIMNVLNIKFSLLPLNFSILLNLLTCIT